jgi:hypothetical protein
MRRALAALLAIASHAAADPVPPHREAARAALEVHCGTCHRQDSPGARAKALAVFNLNHDEFALTMAARQLKDALFRLKNLATIDPKEFADAPRDLEAFGGPTTAKELNDFKAFVDEELRRRGR